MEEPLQRREKLYEIDFKTYQEMAKEVGFQVMSCEISVKTHKYIPYLFWRSVNPFLPRIKEANERENFVEELHKTTMNYFQENQEEYPFIWTKLLIVHLRKG